MLSVCELVAVVVGGFEKTTAELLCDRSEILFGLADAAELQEMATEAGHIGCLPSVRLPVAALLESFRSELVAKCYRIVTDNDPAIVHAFAVNQVEPNGGRRRSLGVTVVHPARRGVMDEQNEVLESLAEKLNSLALNEEERAAFGALLGAETGEGEDEGFAKRIYVGNLPLIQGFNIGMPPRVIDADIGPGAQKAYDLNPND